MARLIWKLLPWFLLGFFIFILSITNHCPFEKEEKFRQTVETSLILDKIEQLGRLELVKYNFKELLEYKRTSDGKIIGNSLLNIQNYHPDLSVVLVATGEAVGCIDLTKINESDILVEDDTVFVQLPAPELCYYKLDMANTKLYSFKKDSWWSRLFTDEQEKTQILHLAYQKAEARLKDAAISSGIYQSTNENVAHMLKPLMEQLTGKTVIISTSLSTVAVEPY
ncbi:MAG: DUF4230 domain-containing protein [Cyclobacteriaceae bacterium]|nr:DUF4230 domain-containing protein [Cyclobacteriaceae bacterium]